MVKFEKVPSGGTVLGAMQFPHPGDTHLWVVLVQLGEEEYCVWTCNTQTMGYSSGDYFTFPMNSPGRNRELAYHQFIASCAGRVSAYYSKG
jgi:hypothetical protein